MADGIHMSSGTILVTLVSRETAIGIAHQRVRLRYDPNLVLLCTGSRTKAIASEFIPNTYMQNGDSMTPNDAYFDIICIHQGKNLKCTQITETCTNCTYSKMKLYADFHFNSRCFHTVQRKVIVQLSANSSNNILKSNDAILSQIQLGTASYNVFAGNKHM